jgi:outer membrane lipoprotein-sorting protein
MHRLFCSAFLSALAFAQTTKDAAELLQKAQSVAASTRNWRAEVVEISEIAGGGIHLKSEVRIRIAAEAPLKMRRQNSGDDQTVMVCDGIESFYSGDGHSYYRRQAKETPDCDYSLSKFYNLDKNAATAEVVGRDHVRLADGDRQCVLVRAESERETTKTVHTLCIDSVSGVILRDVEESKDSKTGRRILKTTAFTAYESNPKFQADTFAFAIPPGG